MTQRTITIGYQRQHDIAVLATLNNIGGLLTDEDFEDLITTTICSLQNHIVEDVRAWEREDAPDYLTYDEESFGVEVSQQP